MQVKAWESSLKFSPNAQLRPSFGLVLLFLFGWRNPEWSFMGTLEMHYVSM